METEKALQLLGDKVFLDRLYHFSYHRCNSSLEAEELCAEILFAIIAAVHKQERLENFDAFVWTVARRAYADYCERRSAQRCVQH